MHVKAFQPEPVSIGGHSGTASCQSQRDILPSTNRRKSAFYRPVEEARKDNSLALARYCLSARAQKFVLFAITLIDRSDHHLEKMYTVHAAEFANWADLSLQSVRRDLWDPPAKQRELSIGRELLKEILILPDYFQPERGKATALGTHWFSAIMPETPHGPCAYLDVNFNPRLAPLIQMVRERYYTFQRVMIQRFQSGYSIRLYEWLESNLFRRQQLKNRFSIGLDELRGVLGTDRPTDGAASKSFQDKSLVTLDEVVYRRRLALFGHFKKRALDVAVAEINAYTPWTLEVQTLRARGARKVGGIVFVVHDKPLTNPVTAEKTQTSGGNRGRRAACSPSQTLLDYPPPSAALLAVAPAIPEGTPVPLLEPTTKEVAAAPFLPLTVPSEPLPAVTTDAAPTPEKSDEDLLMGMVIKLADDYHLTTHQIPLVLGYARANSCETPRECADYICRHSDRTRRERPTNPAQHLLAALKGNFKEPVKHNRIKPVLDPFRERDRKRAEEGRTAARAALAAAESAQASRRSEAKLRAATVEGLRQMQREIMGPGLYELMRSKQAQEIARS